MSNNSIEKEAKFARAKERLFVEQQLYMQDHPEIKQMLHDFVSDCLVHKPSDVREHARIFFSKFTSNHGEQFIPPLHSVLPHHPSFAEQNASSSGLPCSDNHPNRQRPLVVCGPSGVGKGTLLKRLFEEYGQVFAPVVSHTSRAPRPGEIDGVHYHFSNVEDMRRDIDAGLFVEHAQVHQNLYGKSKKSIEAVQDQGKVCLLELDVQGAESIKRSDLNAHFLFISPPSLEQLEERLRGRGTESEEQVRVRLGGAHREMSYLQRDDGFFDAVVVNDEFEVSYASLLDTLAQFYPDLLPASE